MDQYLVYGNPISQSRSPAIHQNFAAQTEQKLSYKSALVALDAFEQTVTEFSATGGKGANITVPFKEQALELCHHLSERARLAGAVNTLTFKNGLIYGDNTDGLGLVQDLLNNDILLENSRVLLLGAGGAARGVILPLLEQKVAQLVLANRTVSKAKTLCQQFSDSRMIACGFDEIENQHYDVIINATSASLSGTVPPISDQLVSRETVCYDMVYAKEATPFLIWAKQHHAKKSIDGLGMLVGQAAESFNIWRGIKPKAAAVLLQLRQELLKE